jgi:hypothetical protein
VIVAIAGLVVIGVGVHQRYKGVARKFLEDSDTAGMSQGARGAFTALGHAAARAGNDAVCHSGCSTRR